LYKQNKNNCVYPPYLVENEQRLYTVVLPLAKKDKRQVNRQTFKDRDRENRTELLTDWTRLDRQCNQTKIVTEDKKKSPRFAFLNFCRQTIGTFPFTQYASQRYAKVKEPIFANALFKKQSKFTKYFRNFATCIIT
jgi:hypothetical protein